MSTGMIMLKKDIDKDKIYTIEQLCKYKPKQYNVIMIEDYLKMNVFNVNALLNVYGEIFIILDGGKEDDDEKLDENFGRI